MQITTNGYTNDAYASTFERFNDMAAKNFPSATVKHFFYGDHISMADIVLEDGHYAHFNVSKGRISLTGYTCSNEELAAFRSMQIGVESWWTM